MRLNEIKDNPGARKTRVRIGRGIGSGVGKTGGRGGKGQTARSGVAIGGFEGGQMPLHRRLPKRGFTKWNRKDWNEINIGALQKAVDEGKLKAGQDVDVTALVDAGILRRPKDGLRLLGTGEITAKLARCQNAVEGRTRICCNFQHRCDLFGLSFRKIGARRPEAARRFRPGRHALAFRQPFEVTRRTGVIFHSPCRKSGIPVGKRNLAPMRCEDFTRKLVSALVLTLEKIGSDDALAHLVEFRVRHCVAGILPPQIGFRLNRALTAQHVAHFLVDLAEAR